MYNSGVLAEPRHFPVEYTRALLLDLLHSFVPDASHHRTRPEMCELISRVGHSTAFHPLAMINNTEMSIFFYCLSSFPEG